MNDAGIMIYLIAALILLILVLIGLSIHLALRVKKMERKYRRFMRGQEGISLEKHFTREFDRLDDLTEKLRIHKGEIAMLRQKERQNFTKYGIVKYDAFEDVGGKLSFVLALLNDEDTGIVLNAIHSKDNCYLYLKEIVKGESYIMLSNEEIDALQAARNNEASTESRMLRETTENNKEAEPENTPEENSSSGKTDSSNE